VIKRGLAENLIANANMKLTLLFCRMNADDDDAKHNKYCHFCQHVKLRASAMLACSNKGCARRFCEHCLVNQVNPANPPFATSFYE
jgi:hypothetical protein